MAVVPQGRGGRRRLRRPRGRPGPAGRAGRGHPRRPAQLPHLPAAAVPGRHGRAEPHRRGPRRAGPVPPAGERAVPAGPRHRRRLDALAPCPSTGQPDLPFDHLVLAAGATVTWFDTPGAAEHGFPLYTLDDATRLRNHVLRALRGGRPRPDARSIAAGSPSWWSAAAPPASRPPARSPSCSPWCSARTTRTSTSSRARVVLVEMQDHLLHPFTASSRRHALETLRSRGVDVRLGAQVASVVVRRGDPRRRRGAAVPDARSGRPACRPTRWPPPSTSRRAAAAGSRSSRTCACRAARARGRSATWPPPPTGAARCCPQLAPVAMQSGRHVARQIRRLLEGRPTTPFRYLDKGTMATIGRRAAVAELPGRIRLRGGLGLAGVARPAPRHARRAAQPGVGAPQLGVELPHLGPRPPPHHRVRVPPPCPLTPPRSDPPSTPTAPPSPNGDQDAYVGLFADDAWIEDPVGHAEARGPRRASAAFFDADRARWPTRSSCA